MSLAALVSSVPRLGAMIPNEVDEHTLHLWHLDEDGPPFFDSGISSKPLLGLLNGAQAGLESQPGLGRAVSFDRSAGGEPLTNYYKGAMLLAQPLSVDGPEDNVTAPFPIMGDDGAFTIEALIKFDRLPSEAPGVALTIVSMDSESIERVFNFRIEKPGFLSFTPFSGKSLRGGGLATIPVSGPNAINTRDWFHVAVSYDGHEGSAGNLKLYWTRLVPGLATASLLGSGTLISDLSRDLGDFAIGNTGRTVLGKKECNPFPGLIDEVRISGIARSANDFFFVTPESKTHERAGTPSGSTRPEFRLGINQVEIDGRVNPLPRDPGKLFLAPGAHRVDIDFSLPQGTITEKVGVRCRLEGIDDLWQPAIRGMLLVCEVLDKSQEVISRASFASIGQSNGWTGDPYDTPLNPRLEPLFLPRNAKSLRITLSSGTPDTTGQIVIDNLSITLPSNPKGKTAIWSNGGFDEGQSIYSASGTPTGWQREGDDPAIARLVPRLADRAIALVDGTQKANGSWVSVRKLPGIPALGCSVLVSWDEAYSVIGGSSYRATYLSVPPGSYQFRAIAVTRAPSPASTHLELPIVVRSPIWENPWFRPVTASIAVGLIALVILQTYRRRALARFSKLNLQHTLERDRARIARDMHDDLGTRVSSLIMGTSLVHRDLDRDPAASRRNLVWMGDAARDLATAMDSLVWAVDPANDSLEQLAAHLSGLAQEIFRDGTFRLRINLPTDLPPIPLRSEFRHHFSLAVKEALHNVSKHAGACDVSLDLAWNNGELTAVVRDNGRGFDPSSPAEGNGLFNFHSRLTELGGTCQLESRPGLGTTVTFRCPLLHQTDTTRS